MNDPDQAAENEAGTPVYPVIQDFCEDVCEEDENEREDQLCFVGQVHAGTSLDRFMLIESILFYHKNVKKQIDRREHLQFTPKKQKTVRSESDGLSVRFGCAAKTREIRTPARANLSLGVFALVFHSVLYRA